MAMNKMIKVEVAYAAIDKVYVCEVEIEENATVHDAITRSGILMLFPKINLNKQKIGIFSKPCSLTSPLQAGDRVEIYRPLVIDPKEARRKKAKRKN